ncbi:MAG: type II toxin-antitoxin system RelE/ParE family toxin [Candidatus Contendobacter sp.]
MLKLDPSRQAEKFLSDVQQGNPKHARQLGQKLQALLENPNPPDAKPLKGEPAGYWRADVGEYRLIYRIEGDVLKLALVGKHNDDDIYRQFERLR